MAFFNQQINNIFREAIYKTFHHVTIVYFISLRFFLNKVLTTLFTITIFYETILLVLSAKIPSKHIAVV